MLDFEREAIFAGKLKGFYLFSGSALPAVGLATQDENLIHSIHNLWRKKITAKEKLGGAY